jgi:PIN domain nuclease of toxin-antitoxin system
MIVDTQIVFWIAQAPELLSAKAVEAIDDARLRSEAICISDKTLWELAMMIQRGVVVVKTTPRDFLSTVEQVFRVLPITAAVAERSVQFSSRFPKDPSDRIIAATAIVHGMPLITADGQIRESGEVPCIW